MRISNHCRRTVVMGVVMAIAVATTPPRLFAQQPSRPSAEIDAGAPGRRRAVLMRRIAELEAMAAARTARAAGFRTLAASYARAAARYGSPAPSDPAEEARRLAIKRDLERRAAVGERMAVAAERAAAAASRRAALLRQRLS